jgi:hypothetical protein
MVIERPYVWVVWDILREFFFSNPVEDIPPLWECYLGSVFASVSPKAVDWVKSFFVVFLTTGSSLGAHSNCLAVPREEPSPISGSFSFGALSEHLVVGFIGGIVPAT